MWKLGGDLPVQANPHQGLGGIPPSYRKVRNLDAGDETQGLTRAKTTLHGQPLEVLQFRFMFVSLVHFELIFVVWCEVKIKVYFPTWYLVVLAQYDKN